MKALKLISKMLECIKTKHDVKVVLLVDGEYREIDGMNFNGTDVVIAAVAREP
jgi:hypothetical protein